MPLSAWLIAPASWPGGQVTQTTAVLPSLLAALGVVTVTYWIAWRLFSADIALVTGLIVVTTYGVFDLARVAMPDMMLCLAVTAAMAAFVATESGGHRSALIAAYALVGVASLTKGPVALLRVVIVTTYALVAHGPPGLRRLAAPIGLLLLGLLVVPWWLLGAASDRGGARRDVALTDWFGWYVPRASTGASRPGGSCSLSGSSVNTRTRRIMRPPPDRRRLLLTAMLGVALAAIGAATPVVTVSPAAAEWMLDLYGGWTITNRNDVKATTAFSGSRISGTVPEVVFDPSSAVGGRVGYWFESLPDIGLSLDAFYFQPDWAQQRAAPNTLGAAEMKHAQLWVTSISLDMMLRLPVWPTPEFPRGRLQPYLTVGPALAVTSLWMDLPDDVLPQIPEPSTSRRDVTTAVGVLAGAGVAWQLQTHVALFAEYRFTHFSPEFTLNAVGGWGPTTIRTDLDSHTILGGISFRF